MTLVDQRATPASSVLESVGDLAPGIAARAAEIEAARRVPTDLLDDLKAAGCFRILRPDSHAGIGTDLPSAMAVFEALARPTPRSPGRW